MFNPKRHHQIFREMDKTPTVLQDGVLMTMNGVPVERLAANVKESLYVPDQYRFLMDGTPAPNANPFAPEQPIQNEQVSMLMDRINRLESLLVGRDGMDHTDPASTIDETPSVDDMLNGVIPVVIQQPTADNYDVRKSGGLVTKTRKGMGGPRVVKIGKR